MPAEENRPPLEIQEVEWHWLRPHQERGAVIVVAPALDLTEAGRRIAADDTATVAGWIAAGLLTKPDNEQVEAWNADPTRRLRLLIVQPYVLVQEPAPSEGD